MKFFYALITLAAAPWLISIPARATSPSSPEGWAQGDEELRPDPHVLFGTLRNGLRFAIMRNMTPSDGVAMRMRIGAGSLQESDDQQGFAHFVEHMAFRGSSSIPDGEAVHMLQREGLALGPDTNASTSQTETVYKFNFPKADPTAIDTGLDLFREIGDRLTLSPAAIEAEKGVILSEERLRDTASYRSTKARLGAVLDGTRASARWPIGKTEIIRSADHSSLDRFYRANYRPDETTLIVVGNVDPATVERKIRSLFSDWKPAPPSPAKDLGTPSTRQAVTEFVEPGAPSEIVLSWVGPADRRTDSAAIERENLLKHVALQVFNQRLADRALQQDSPLVGARVRSIGSLFNSASLTEIAIAIQPGQWREALDGVAAEQRALIAEGVSQPELQRAISAARAQIEARAAQESTRRSDQLADAIVQTVDAGSVFTSPTQQASLQLPLLSGITPSQVTASLRTLFGSVGPLLFRSAGQGPVGQADLSDALKHSYATKLSIETQPQETAFDWPYTDFGKPSAVLSQSFDSNLGLTTVRFGNGTVLRVKPTTFEKDRVQVAVCLGDGRAGADSTSSRKLWEASFFPLGGTGKMSFTEISHWIQLTGTLASVRLAAGARSFILSGSTRPGQILRQMQLLAAYSRDPGFRSEAVAKARSLSPLLAGQIRSSPTAVFTRGTQALLVGGDPRYRELPATSDLEGVDNSDLPNLLRPGIGGRADVVMVGDISVNDAIKATQSTFAAGARSNPPAMPPAEVVVRLPVRTQIFEHAGRSDQAIYGEYFALPDFFSDPATSHAAQVAAAVLQARLIDTVREKLGLTYSPKVVASSSIELRGAGYFASIVETPAANFQAFHAALAQELLELARKKIDADELERAKQPLIEAQRKKLQNNGFWLMRLTELSRDPRIRNAVTGESDGISAVTADDVRKIFADFLANKAPAVMISRAAQTGGIGTQ